MAWSLSLMLGLLTRARQMTGPCVLRCSWRCLREPRSHKTPSKPTLVVRAALEGISNMSQSPASCHHTATTLLITRPRPRSFLASQGLFLVFTAFITISFDPQNACRKQSRHLHHHSEPWKPCPEQVCFPACPISLCIHPFLMLLSPFSKRQYHPASVWG